MCDKEKEKNFDKVIDRELLISSVEQRPVLWDKYLDIYKDKVAKTAAWREICLILNENFEEIEQKERQLFGKCVIKRWTQIRDAWVKSLNTSKTSKKSGSAAVSVRTYKYHKELNFLKKIVDPGDTHDNISTTRNKTKNKDEDVVLEKNNCEQTEVNQNEIDGQKGKSDKAEKNETNQKSTGNQKGTCLNPPIRKRKSVSEVDEKIISLIDNQLKQPKEKVDEDRNLTFFKSILPSLTVFDDDQILEFQSEVIHLIQTIKRKRTYNDWSQNSYNYAHNYQSQYQGYFTRPDPAQSPSVASISTQPDPEQSPSAASISTQLDPAQSPSTASNSPQPDPMQSASAASTPTENQNSEYIVDLDLSNF